jgi:hypothetical protein
MVGQVLVVPSVAHSILAFHQSSSKQYSIGLERVFVSQAAPCPLEFVKDVMLKTPLMDVDTYSCVLHNSLGVVLGSLGPLAWIGATGVTALDVGFGGNHWSGRVVWDRISGVQVIDASVLQSWINHTRSKRYAESRSKSTKPYNIAQTLIGATSSPFQNNFVDPQNSNAPGPSGINFLHTDQNAHNSDDLEDFEEISAPSVTASASPSNPISYFVLPNFSPLDSTD